MVVMCDDSLTIYRKYSEKNILDGLLSLCTSYQNSYQVFACTCSIHANSLTQAFRIPGDWVYFPAFAC